MTFYFIFCIFLVLDFVLLVAESNSIDDDYENEFRSSDNLVRKNKM